MGSGGGAGSSQQTTTNAIAPQLQPLFGQTGTMIQGFQQDMPDFGQFFQPNRNRSPDSLRASR